LNIEPNLKPVGAGPVYFGWDPDPIFEDGRLWTPDLMDENQEFVKYFG
jgi:hypothetical protein